MTLAGVTRVTLAKALRLTQPYCASDVAYRRERLEVRRLFRLPYRGRVPVTPPTVGCNLKGSAQPYPGLVYEATRSSDAYGWHRATLTGSPAKPPLAERETAATTLAERETAARSTSARPKCSPWAMEWMWLDPVGFAAADPEYFVFIWDTVVRGR